MNATRPDPAPPADGAATALARAAAAAPAAAGHFDELRDRPGAEAGNQDLAPAWRQILETCETDGLGNLDQRMASLERQIRDNGVTYNVYADQGGPQRPWSLGLFPLIVSAQSWQTIEAGVRQRARLLDRVMADVYGPQDLLARGLLPPALVQGHPGYLRALHGVPPVGGTHLNIAAFDLARGPDGHWWVAAQRTQAPSGMGYLLENRLAISRLFPQAFESLPVQHLAATYQALMDHLKAMSPAGADAHIALLTPGPYNETYFEHAYLARYLGLSLVQGSDLIVREQRLYLRTLRGLVPVHGLLKRLDDEFLDPLELRADSTLGVPGLLQVIRAGNLVVANAPGSAFLESPALLGFLPGVCRHLLDEDLRLPALPTWWCGESAALDDVLPRLHDCAITPTYPGGGEHGGFDTVRYLDLTPRERDAWAARLQQDSDDYTVQTPVPLSQMPIWHGPSRSVLPRSVLLRVYAVADGPQSWRVLPGGLARVAGDGSDVTSMQHGGGSADVWALTTGAVDTTALLQPSLTPSTLSQRKRLVTSRAAENLFWLGRYTERADNGVRLARLTLEALGGEDQSSPPLLTWLGRMAVRNTLVLPGVPAPTPQSRRVFERALIASLGSNDQATSVGFSLRALRLAGAAVRERLSPEHWHLVQRTEDDFSEGCATAQAGADCSAVQALATLQVASDHLAALTGQQSDRMTRDDGWRLLSIGRHIERLGFLANALRQGLEAGSVHDIGGFEAMVALFDSSITFHAQYQQSRGMAALLDLLVLDRDNPRSLAWVVHTLHMRLAKLADNAPDPISLLSCLPDPTQWQLEALCEAGSDQRFEALTRLLLDCGDAAFRVSEDIAANYFTPAGASGRSLGA